MLVGKQPLGGFFAVFINIIIISQQFIICYIYIYAYKLNIVSISLQHYIIIMVIIIITIFFCYYCGNYYSFHLIIYTHYIGHD